MLSSITVSETNSTNALVQYCSQCKNTLEKVMECSQCHFAYYCGKDCQTTDWRNHKPVCVLLKNQSEKWKQRNKSTGPEDFWKGNRKATNISYIQKPPFDSLVDGKIVLDLGCGVGTSSLFLLSKGWKVIAVDFFEEPLNEMKAVADKFLPQFPKTASLETHQASIIDFKFPPNIDLVIATDVFPYIEPLSLGQLCTKIRNCLKREGIFIGSFFEQGHVCETLHGAWVVNSQQTVRTLLTDQFFEVVHCDFRPKATGSKVIDFMVKNMIPLSEKK